MVFKFFIAYTVCVDSISIILACEGVKDAIFNGVALSFISDLDETAWKVTRQILNLNDFSTFEFRMAEMDFRNKKRQAFIQLPKILRRGNGARFVENSLVKS